MRLTRQSILNVVLAAIAAALLGACASSETKRSTGEFTDDAALTAKVKSAIATDVGARTAAAINIETYRGVRYDFWTPWMMLRAQPWPGLTASIDATFGGEIDYQAERLARTVRLGPSATVRVTREAEIRVRHSAVRLRAGDQSLLRASVSELRAEYHPTSRTFARALLQHHASHRSAASVPLVVPSQARGLASQLLLSYRVDAQTAALVGYGDAREAPDAARGTDAKGSLSDDLRPMARSFFVKLSNALNATVVKATGNGSIINDALLA